MRLINGNSAANAIWVQGRGWWLNLADIIVGLFDSIAILLGELTPLATDCGAVNLLVTAVAPAATAGAVLSLCCLPCDMKLLWLQPLHYDVECCLFHLGAWPSDMQWWVLCWFLSLCTQLWECYLRESTTLKERGSRVSCTWAYTQMVVIQIRYQWSYRRA